MAPSLRRGFAPRRCAITGIALAVLALLILAHPANGSGGTVDLGDAPDGAPAGYASAPAIVGHFPSKKSSGGPQHTKLGQLLIGLKEDGEGDSMQVDKDAFDDGVGLDLANCARSTAYVLVNATGLTDSSLTAADTVYVNAWFDWNRDGDWADGSDGCASEWAIENLPVSADKLAGSHVLVVPIDFEAGKQVDELWYRVTITLNEPATDPTGRGGVVPYGVGETEDGLIAAGTSPTIIFPPPIRKKPPPPPPPPKKKKKFKIICQPNPALMFHGGKTVIKLKIVKGSGVIDGDFESPRNTGSYSVTPNPRKAQPKGFPRPDGRFVADTLTVKSKKVDPPTRIEVIVIRLRFRQGKQVQRLKCFVLVVHFGRGIVGQPLGKSFPPIPCDPRCGGRPSQPPPPGVVTGHWHKDTATEPGQTVPIEIVALSLTSVQPLTTPMDGFRIPLSQFAFPWSARLVRSSNPGTVCDVGARLGGPPSLDCHFPRLEAGQMIDSFFDIFFEIPPPPGTGFGGVVARYDYDSLGRIVRVTDADGLTVTYQEVQQQPPPPPVQHQLVVSVSGGGSVTDDKGKITCPGTCTGSYDTGTAVALSAAPETGMQFTGWTGDCSGTGACQLTMDADHSVGATFTPIAPVNPKLTITIGGTTTGNERVFVQDNHGGTNQCAPANSASLTTPKSPCQFSYPTGTMVQIGAQGDAGNTTFQGWGGDCTGSMQPCNLNMNADKSVTATFG